ncbi:MAG TPA: hypothetical protein VKY57_02245 [Chitinispirillaceae bacterium]|nr:hypothetical protein [Chitinispirillaceae bacterium]
MTGILYLCSWNLVVSIIKTESIFSLKITGTPNKEFNNGVTTYEGIAYGSFFSE